RPPAHVPEGDVQDGAALGDVDAFAAEHLVPGALEPGGAGEAEEEVERLVRDELLAVIDEHLGGAQRQQPGEALGAAGVGGEGRPQAEARSGVAVTLERVPGGAPRRLVPPAGAAGPVP